VAIGNLMHFLVAAFALLKYAPQASPSAPMWALAAIYAILALAFGLIVFGNPLRAADSKAS
jgi:hypothetical protein